MRKIFWIVFISIFLGCSTSQIKLDKKWHPLETIIEDPLQEESVYYAWDKAMHISSFKNWNNRSKIKKHASLLHERVHIVNQEEYGLIMFFLNYGFSPTFRLEQEKLAYKVEILYLISKGRTVNIEYYAKTLSGSLYNNMVSYSSIKKWLVKISSKDYKKSIPAKYWVEE